MSTILIETTTCPTRAFDLQKSLDSYPRHHCIGGELALLGVEVNDVDWPLAVTGHPATAIRVAVRHLHAYGMTSPVIDAVVSAVSCCALEGNHAARVVVSSALRRRKKIDPFCHELCLLWRAARF